MHPVLEMRPSLRKQKHLDVEEQEVDDRLTRWTDEHRELPNNLTGVQDQLLNDRDREAHIVTIIRTLQYKEMATPAKLGYKVKLYNN